MTEKRTSGATRRGQAGGTERDAYRREKQEERGRMERPAEAAHDAAWQGRDHLDPLRDPHRPSRGGAAKDGEGQAERGTIDQTITSEGYTEDR